ncbi:hypothetical protein PRIPAC_73749, partial [Pristionchus pacificus]
VRSGLSLVASPLPLLFTTRSVSRRIVMNGKSRGRRKTNWRTVNLAAYDPICSGEYDLEEYAPPRRVKAPSSPPPFDDTVTTRSDWKYMGKQVRKMLIPGSISAFASCMWVSLELVHGAPIAAFSKIVELALPFWDALHADEQDAWAERAFAEARRAHWIYVRNGRSGGTSGPMGAASHIACHASSDARPSPRSRKKAQEWDDDYDDEELSDTDELPSRPTRKLNIDGDDAEPEGAPVPKEFKSEDAAPSAPSLRPPAPIGTPPSGNGKTVTFRIDHHDDEPPREPWRERDGTRTVPPPPLTYRPIIVSANPPAQNIPPPASFYPTHSALRGRSGVYMGRRPYRGGFDMYPPAASGAVHMSAPVAHLAPHSSAPWARGFAPRGAHGVHMAAPPIGFR